MTVEEAIVTDVLVVGGGLAALRAAIAAREAGATVRVAVKGKLGRSGASAMTTAGYAAVMPEAETGDSLEAHAADTHRGGWSVCDPALVGPLVEEGPGEVRRLEALGATFVRDDGRYRLSPSGDHSHPRVLTVPNGIGTDLTLPMLAHASAIGVEPMEFVAAVELLRDDDGIAGALCIDLRGGRLVPVVAGAVILATGGAGRLFSITSNPRDVTGDGYALAARAGAVLRDMEFIQFYPWRVIDPFPRARVSLQPSTFVLGGRLYNAAGERFMERVNPDGAEATTRDVSARGIFQEMRAGRGVGEGVRADLSAIPPDAFERSNPKIARHLGTMGIDYRTYPFIVGPEAHYFMGGLAVDPRGAATVPGLWAAGEATGGIHGANRVNSNALPETMVFGAHAGEDAASRTRRPAVNGAVSDATARWRGRLNGAGDSLAAAALAASLDDLRREMWWSLGIVRGDDAMRDGLAGVRRRRAEVGAARPADGRALRDWLDIQMLCEVAEMSLEAALARTESRGAHYRDSFPDRDDAAWTRPLLVTRDADGAVTTTPGDPL